MWVDLYARRANEHGSLFADQTAMWRRGDLNAGKSLFKSNVQGVNDWRHTIGRRLVCEETK